MEMSCMTDLACMTSMTYLYLGKQNQNVCQLSQNNK